MGFHLHSAELTPGRASSSRRRVKTRPSQDVPERGRSDTVAQTDQLPVYPAMTPARIVPSKPDNQSPDRDRDRRSTTRAAVNPPVGPPASDQLTMPTQHRRRTHDPSPPQTPRQQPTQRRDQQPILRLQPRTTDLPPQHHHLVPQHQQLDVLRGLTTTAQHNQAQPGPHEGVHDRQQHRSDHAEHPGPVPPRFLSPTGFDSESPALFTTK